MSSRTCSSSSLICTYSFPAWICIKGTDAHRDSAPASEIHPVTYGTGLALRFFPSDTVNEGIFSFPRILGEKCSLWTHPPLTKWRIAHSCISAKTSSSQDSPTGRGSRLTTQQNVQQGLFLSLTSEDFWFEFLYIFRYTFYEPEAQIGVRYLLNPLEFIVYLCFMAACVYHSASKFHVCVCVCINTCALQSGRD